MLPRLRVLGLPAADGQMLARGPSHARCGNCQLRGGSAGGEPADSDRGPIADASEAAGGRGDPAELGLCGDDGGDCEDVFHLEEFDEFV